MDVSPYLDFEEASRRLQEKFNVKLAPGTIENKVYQGLIPSQSVAGKRRIHKDELDAWALSEEPAVNT